MQMYCPALKLHTPPFPVVYSPATCAWCLTLSFSSFLRQNGHTVVARKSLSILGEFSNGNSSKRYSFTLSYNCTRYSMKGRRSSSLSCGAWKTRSWFSMAGMRDTARHDSMIGLCLFLSSMADSKSAYTTTGAGISNCWLVNRIWVYCYSNSNNSRSFIWSNLNESASPSPFIHIRSINKSLLMRLLLVHSCSNDLSMLDTRFTIWLWWSRSTIIIATKDMHDWEKQLAV